MENEIKKLIKEGRYKEIVKLEGDCYNSYKCVALIFLEDFQNALKYAEVKSFNKAYILYKLKKFKKSLGVLKHMNPEESRVIILKSQCYWEKGLYEKAYSLLSKIDSTELGDARLVNLAAVRSLMSDKSSLKPMEEIGNKDLQINGEYNSTLLDFEYNKTFTDFEDESKFIERLENLNNKYKVKNSVISIQLDNLLNDKKGYYSHPENEKEVLTLNSGEKRSRKVERKRILSRFQYEIYMKNKILRKESYEFHKSGCQGLRTLVLWKLLSIFPKTNPKLMQRNLSFEKFIKMVEKLRNNNLEVLTTKDLEIFDRILVHKKSL